MEFFITTLDTPNFRFEATGRTETEALELLEAAWSRHFDEMGQRDDILSFDGILDAIEQPNSRYFLATRKLRLGEAYRDGEPFARAGHAVVA